MNKMEIASDLLRAIRGLELSPSEVKCLTLMWLSFYPSLTEEKGWEIKVRTPVQEGTAEIEKTDAVSENTQKTEIPEETKEVPESAVASQEQPVTTEQEILNVPPKGYSKNGKRLGRPARKKTEETTENAASENAQKTDVPAETEKVTKSAVAPSEQPATTEQKVLILPCKGYSKNGKRLGRPPRKKTEEKAEDVHNDEPARAVVAEIKKPKLIRLPRGVMPSVAQPKKMSQAEIERLKYGKEYGYDLLYLVNKFYVRSRFKLREEAGVTPMGVIIPYVLQNLRYEMVVYYADEHALIPVNMAMQYAQNELLPYKDVAWRIKKQSDDIHIRPALGEVNEIFKKMGGDELKGTYVDGDGQHGSSRVEAQHKIRYVCDIPLSGRK